MEKLIICDDDKDILQMMSIALRNQSFEIIKIDHCDYLQQSIDQHNPFLVLIDLSFKSANVKTLIASLKNDEKYSFIPILVFSGQEDVDKVSHDIGADGFIAKPFKLKEVREKIFSYLN